MQSACLVGCFAVAMALAACTLGSPPAFGGVSATAVASPNGGTVPTATIATPAPTAPNRAAVTAPSTPTPSSPATVLSPWQGEKGGAYLGTLPSAAIIAQTLDAAVRYRPAPRSDGPLTDLTDVAFVDERRGFGVTYHGGIYMKTRRRCSPSRGTSFPSVSATCS